MSKINEFRGENQFLSNFYPSSRTHKATIIEKLSTKEKLKDMKKLSDASIAESSAIQAVLVSN